MRGPTKPKPQPKPKPTPKAPRSQPRLEPSSVRYTPEQKLENVRAAHKAAVESAVAKALAAGSPTGQDVRASAALAPGAHAAGKALGLPQRGEPAGPNALNAALLFTPGPFKAVRAGVEGFRALRAGKTVVEAGRAAREGYRAGKGAVVAEKVAPEAQAARETPISRPLYKQPKVPPVTKGTAPEAQGGELGRQVREGLRGARGARKEQNVLYSQERGKRAGAYAEALKADPTVEGAHAALRELGGELPKLRYEGFQHFDQNSLNAMVKHVAGHPTLRPFEKASTIKALEQITGGKVPTEGQINLLGQVFGSEVSHDLVSSVSSWYRLKQRGLDILNIPRSLMSSFDVSAPFRQGLVVATSHPVMFSKNLVPMVKALGSERVYQHLLDEVHARPTFPLMQKGGVAFTELGRTLNQREEQFVSNMAESIPGLGHVVRASGRAYTGFLDKTRADLFDALVEKATKAGRNPAEDQHLIESISKFVNSATGRGSLGAMQKHAVTLNTLMFSPRLLASRLNFLNPVYYVKLDRFARREAIRAAVQLVSTIGLVLETARLAGAEVSADPRAADFGKIKVGDTRIDIAGGFQQPIRLLSQLATQSTVSSTTGEVIPFGQQGPGNVSSYDVLQRFARSKSAPLPSALWDLSTKETFTGQPLSWQNTVLPRVTPMVGGDVTDLYKNTGSIPAAVGGYGLGAVGFGVQTYKQTPPKSRGKDQKDPWNIHGGGGASDNDPWKIHG